VNFMFMVNLWSILKVKTVSFAQMVKSKRIVNCTKKLSFCWNHICFSDLLKSVMISTEPENIYDFTESENIYDFAVRKTYMISQYSHHKCFHTTQIFDVLK
jgi:hypothetical protein